MLTFRAILATSLMLSACVPAAAQYRRERPYRGIFASGIDSVGQSLTAQGTLSGGYDDNVLAGTRVQNSIRRQQEGAFTQFSGGLNYAHGFTGGSINAAVGTSQRYYPSLEREYYRNYNASIGGTLQVSARPAITLHQSVSYRPYTFLEIFPDTVEPPVGASDVPDPDLVPLFRQYVAYTGGADLSQRITRRTTVSSFWNYGITDRLSNHFWRQSAGASFSVAMTRDLSARVGYRYTEGHHDDRVTRIHRPEIGLDFLRALSLTRRTSLTFGIGMEATAYNQVTRLIAVGNARVVHEIGRSWTVGAVYRRGTYFVETLPEPVTGNSASAQVNGLITRRLQLSGVVSGSFGQMGPGAARHYDSYRGSISLSSAITRHMNVGVDYGYYHYLFDDIVVLEPGLARDINRQTIRGHVSFWAPIWTRRANASR